MQYLINISSEASYLVSYSEGKAAAEEIDKLNLGIDDQLVIAFPARVLTISSSFLRGLLENQLARHRKHLSDMVVFQHPDRDFVFVCTQSLCRRAQGLQ